MGSILGSVIQTISTFFTELLTQLSGAKYLGITTTSAVALLLAIYAIKFVRTFAELAGEHNSSAIHAIGRFFKQHIRFCLVWFFIVGSPVIFGAMGGIILGRVQVLAGGPIATRAQDVINTMGTAAEAIWESQAYVRMVLANDSPAMFGGFEDAGGAVQDLQGAEASVQKLRQTAMESAQNQLATAQKLAASKNQTQAAQGRAMTAQAKQRLRDAQQLGETFQQAKQDAKGTQQDQADSSADTTTARAVTGVLSLGMSEIALFAKRCITGLVALALLFPALLLVIMAIWKVITGMIGIFAQLLGFAAVVALSIPLAVVLGPLAMLSFANEGEWSRYGHSFISYWLQAYFGSLALSVALSLAATALGSLSGILASCSSVILQNLLGQTSPGAILLRSAMGGLGFMAAGFTLNAISEFLGKAPNAGIGPVSGTFHV